MGSNAPSSSDRTRTNWTPTMERFFIDLMLDQMHRGNRLGHTFNKQAWTDMLSIFNAKFGCKYDRDTLKSHYTNLWKQYNDVKNLLEQNGFSWDDTRKLVVAPPHVWNAYIKGQPDAQVYRNRTLTNFSDLCLIYAYTQADGRYSRSSHDIDFDDDALGVNFEIPVPVTGLTAMSDLAQDVLSIQSTQGSNPGPMVRVPQFLFTCAPSLLLQRGLPSTVQGVAGLGHSPISLPTQLASHFGSAGFAPTFALCLAPKGVMFFGDSPYYMLPNVDITRPLSYTPLIISPLGEYYMEVKSIKINDKDVPIDTALLSINKQGVGGTKLSTINPYTILHHSIFKAVTQIFSKELSAIPQVKPVAPFGACFNSKRFKNSRVGPGVPNIDLVLHDKHVMWRIYGANSLVEAAPGVSCLAFVDGGMKNNGASIIIGAYQMENNLVQFDMARSRLGFSSSLLFYKTSCNNFNFTAIP
ncbi:hypothetical protein GOBAR_DD13893 [Gossypium barbadense]|nr:hypothetical protein GOBAR_DD13893 [Gossypium barbadense]